MSALKTVQAYYTCFNNQDWEGMLALLDPAIRHEVNQGEAQIGVETFRAFLQHMDECYAEQLSDFTYFTEPNDQKVAVEFTVSGVYKKTDPGLPEAQGQTYVLPVGAFLEVADGKIKRVTNYYNLPLWMKLVS
jgi:steroid delta-isomerase-like uncharacterized protein